MQTMELMVARSDTSDATYKVTPVVIVAFEREFKIGMGRAFGDGAENKAEWMFWLAWKSVQMSGETVTPFDKWIDGLVGVEIVEADIVPFTGDQPDG